VSDSEKTRAIGVFIKPLLYAKSESPSGLAIACYQIRSSLEFFLRTIMNNLITEYQNHDYQ